MDFTQIQGREETIQRKNDLEGETLGQFSISRLRLRCVVVVSCEIVVLFLSMKSVPHCRVEGIHEEVWDVREGI